MIFKDANEKEEYIIKRNIKNVLEDKALDQPLIGLGPKFKKRTYQAIEREALAKEVLKNG